MKDLLSKLSKNFPKIKPLPKIKVPKVKVPTVKSIGKNINPSGFPVIKGLKFRKPPKPYVRQGKLVVPKGY